MEIVTYWCEQLPLGIIALHGKPCILDRLPKSEIKYCAPRISRISRICSQNFYEKEATVVIDFRHDHRCRLVRRATILRAGNDRRARDPAACGACQTATDVVPHRIACLRRAVVLSPDGGQVASLWLAIRTVARYPACELRPDDRGSRDVSRQPLLAARGAAVKIRCLYGTPGQGNREGRHVLSVRLAHDARTLHVSELCYGSDQHQDPLLLVGYTIGPAAGQRPFHLRRHAVTDVAGGSRPRSDQRSLSTVDRGVRAGRRVPSGHPLGHASRLAGPEERGH